jgi:hypothetical protein
MGGMPYHRFQVGQTVVAPSGVRDALIPPGPYIVVRLLPADGGEPHYRVKSTADGHERALLEGQLRPVVAKPAPETERAPAAKPRPAVRQRAAAAKLAPGEKRTATKPASKKVARRPR